MSLGLVCKSVNSILHWNGSEYDVKQNDEIWD